MHRQKGILEVISLWLQEGIKPTTTLQKGLRQAITDFANWQQATRVTLDAARKASLLIAAPAGK